MPTARIIKKLTAAACSALIAFAGIAGANNDTISRERIAAAADEAVTQRNTLTGASLTLTGEIGVNFYLDLRDKAAFDKIVLDGPNGEITLTDGKLAPEAEGEHEGLYKLTYLVDPSQLEETVSVALKNGDESAELFSASGAAYGDDGAEFSVKEYIETVLGDEDAKSDLAALSDALDVYGRYASVQFNGTDDPELDSILADVSADDLEKYKFGIKGDLPAGLSVYGVTLSLDSRTSFRIYFNKDPGSASIDGTDVKAKQRDGRYYIEVPDIPAADLDKEHHAVVGGCTMTFSTLSYVYSAAANEADTSENIIKLAKALYSYSFAANMYFEGTPADEPTISDKDFEVTYDGKDDYAENYSFTYGGETFTVHYTPYSGGDWKVVDSYKITNKADMVLICEKLHRLHKIEGRITRYRTAKDMADEWEIHDQGYVLAKNYGMDSAVARLKDVDMDKKDQGKTFDDFVKDFLGG